MIYHGLNLIAFCLVLLLKPKIKEQAHNGSVIKVSCSSKRRKLTKLSQLKGFLPGNEKRKQGQITLLVCYLFHFASNPKFHQIICDSDLKQKRVLLSHIIFCSQWSVMITRLCTNLLVVLKSS